MKHALEAAIRLAVVSCLAAPCAYADPVPSCGKNHFILEDPVECGIPALLADFNFPGAVATDRWGNVFFSSPNVVFKLDRHGLVSRVAGSGRPGFAGDGGLAAEALLNFPKSYPEFERDPIDFTELLGALATDQAGNLFIADAYNNRVRKVDSKGIIRTVAGSGFSNGWEGGVTDSDGTALRVNLWWPQGIAAGPAGDLFIADGHGELVQVAPDGSIATLATNNCGPGYLGPGLCAPEGIAVDAAGAIYVADGYCRVRKMGTDGELTTIAGADRQYQNGWAYTCGYSGDAGPALDAALAWPFAVAIDAQGDLLIADTANNCIRKVDRRGMISRVAGLCGTRPVPSFAGDGGPALAATLSSPHGVAVGADGSIYIADTGNNRIRKVGADGVITTVAGTGKILPAVATGEKAAP